jgi:hypothetical protein
MGFLIEKREPWGKFSPASKAADALFPCGDS